MANKAKLLNAESRTSNSAYYDRPDHSILSDRPRFQLSK